MDNIEEAGVLIDGYVDGAATKNINTSASITYLKKDSNNNIDGPKNIDTQKDEINRSNIIDTQSIEQKSIQNLAKVGSVASIALSAKSAAVKNNHVKINPFKNPLYVLSHIIQSSVIVILNFYITLIFFVAISIAYAYFISVNELNYALIISLLWPLARILMTYLQAKLVENVSKNTNFYY